MLTANVRTPIRTGPPIEAATDSGTSANGAVVDDHALLTALRAGHEWAFETMVRRYGGRLLAVARRFTWNDEDAQDVLQSAYLSAFRALNDFEGACNTALMKLRSRRRKPEESIDVLLPAFREDGHHVEQFSEWSTPADQLMERKEARAVVRKCIEQLPENYRVVLNLRDIEELSTQEVAGMLSMTPTAVKVRLHRARQALSTLLRKEYASTAVTS